MSIRGQLFVGSCAVALLAALASASAHAQVSVGATAVIGTSAGAGTTGAFAVNETAGLDNAQANQLTITSGTTAGNANLDYQSTQAKASLTHATAVIGEGAFTNTSGAVMVNQSAGVGNIQSNSAQISTAAIGVEMVSDRELSAAVATTGGLARTDQANGIREARIDDAAFRNATGLVQVNQTAGAGNATANSFVLRPPAGTLF